MGVELDHIGTGQTRCAALMVDGGFSHDRARAFVPYFVSTPCELVTVVDVDFPHAAPSAATTYCAFGCAATWRERLNEGRRKKNGHRKFVGARWGG